MLVEPQLRILSDTEEKLAERVGVLGTDSHLSRSQASPTPARALDLGAKTGQIAAGLTT
jgi:hypothetical protein